MFKNGINAIIKPSAKAREDNDKLKKQSGHPIKEKKSIRRYFARIMGGYMCNQGRKLWYSGSIPINHRKPQDEKYS